MNYFISCILTAVLLLSGCATPTAYYSNLNNLMSAGKFSEAADLNQKSKDKVYGGKNTLLYYLDRGFLLHLSGRYEESNDAFDRAKKIATDYFTKSITTEASTLLVSDNMRPYYGEDFERALIHVFSALNYAFLGQESEALVEARQVDHFLTTLEVNYGHKNIYKEDAFARYLMGMIYENEGEINDAFISYWKALEAYEYYRKNFGAGIPENLILDAIRTGNKLGFYDEVGQIKSKWAKGKTDIFVPPSNFGEIVLLYYNGTSPVKVDNFFEISFGRAWVYVENTQVSGEDEEKFDRAAAIARSILAEDQVRMAFPKYTQQEYREQSIKVSALNPAGEALDNDKSEIVENIGALARKTLDDRITRVRIRTIVRATIKFVLAQQISQSVQNNSNDRALGWITKKVLSAASAATELSDKRSWRSLPDTIQVARLHVPAGNQSVNITFFDKSGASIGTKKIENIKVRAGKKTFVTVSGLANEVK